MRLAASTLIAVLCLALGGAAGAQTRPDMERCRSISEEGRRLACYDAIELSPGPRSKYQVVDLAELKSFALSYRGDLIEVRGWIKPGEALLFLGLDESDALPMPIEFESLARRDREAFLEACGGGCDATVQGRVTPVNFTTGIIADALIAH
jgi:hypothetical protein